MVVPVRTTREGRLLDLCQAGAPVSRKALGGLNWNGLFLKRKRLKA